jgi:biotin carboxyl carrier protein
MEYRFKGQGRNYALRLDKTQDNGFTVFHDDTELQVRPVSLDDNRLVLAVDGRRQTFYVAESRDRLFVYFGGRQYVLDKVDAAAEFKGDGDGYGGAEDVIATPMPGKVVKVLVGEGDSVEPNQPVFIIESMKMENEVRSLGRGVVKKVHAAAGDSLNHGDPVVELEPPEEAEGAD